MKGWPWWALIVPLVFATVVTHHVSSWALTALVFLWSGVELVARWRIKGYQGLAPARPAILAGIAAAAWSIVAPTTVGYLAPAVQGAIAEVIRSLSASPGHERSFAGSGPAHPSGNCSPDTRALPFCLRPCRWALPVQSQAPVELSGGDPCAHRPRVPRHAARSPHPTGRGALGAVHDLSLSRPLDFAGRPRRCVSAIGADQAALGRRRPRSRALRIVRRERGHRRPDLDASSRAYRWGGPEVGGTREHRWGAWALAHRARQSISDGPLESPAAQCGRAEHR